MEFPSQLQFQPLPAQDAFALDALRKLLSYLLDNSPFYKDLFAVHNLSAEIEQLEDLKRFPFTTKEDLQLRNWDFLCVPRHAIREYTATSGTMGNPVTIALTEGDLQRLAYNEAQAFLTAGAKPGDVFQLALTLDRQFMAGVAYYSGIRMLGAASVRTGPGLPALQWETSERLHTTAIVAVPSSLVAMIEWAKASGFPLERNSIRKAICIGEPVRNPDFSLNALGIKLRTSWSIDLHSTYAATELQTAFTECGAGRGGHHQPELIIVEIVDEAGNVLPDEVAGEVVITTLGVEAMPLLRYKTGDVAALHSEQCACGRYSKRLGPIIGRKGQMLKYRGTTLYPPAILDLLAGLPFVKESIVEALTSDIDTDELRLHILSGIPEAVCENNLRPLLQSRLRVAPVILFHSPESFKALQMPAGSRKAVRFLDNRKV